MYECISLQTISKSMNDILRSLFFFRFLNTSYYFYLRFDTKASLKEQKDKSQNQITKRKWIWIGK